MLYLVGTPLGNAEDLSPRARRILSEVDAVLCEDTRRTGRLFDYIGVQARLIAFHDHNEQKKQASILDRLRNGSALALVSDAGMPLIHDPGYQLVRVVIAAGLQITCIPGPTAPAVALVLSGFAPTPHAFFGFPPLKSGKRKSFAADMLAWPHTAIAFISPHRGADELAAFAEQAPDRPACLARELTKKFEQIHRGTLVELAELARHDPPKGEWTLVIGPDEPVIAGDMDQMVAAAHAVAGQQNRPLKQVAFELAEQAGLPRRAIYREILKQSDVPDP